MLLNSTSPSWEMKLSMSSSFVMAVKFIAEAEDADANTEADASSSWSSFGVVNVGRGGKLATATARSKRMIISRARAKDVIFMLEVNLLIDCVCRSM